MGFHDPNGEGIWDDRTEGNDESRIVAKWTSFFKGGFGWHTFHIKRKRAQRKCSDTQFVHHLETRGTKRARLLFSPDPVSIRVQLTGGALRLLHLVSIVPLTDT